MITKKMNGIANLHRRSELEDGDEEEDIHTPAPLATSRPLLDSRKDSGQQGSTIWYFGGRATSRSAAVFACQIVILYISIVTCFVNLSLKNGPSELWITLLSISLGSILPSPKVKRQDGGGGSSLSGSGGGIA